MGGIDQGKDRPPIALLALGLARLTLAVELPAEAVPEIAGMGVLEEHLRLLGILDRADAFDPSKKGLQPLRLQKPRV